MPNIVYVLSNPAIPGIVKVGMTDRPDVQRRMSDLHTTGVPIPFDCLIAREIEDREAATDREPGTPNSVHGVRQRPQKPDPVWTCSPGGVHVHR